MDVAETYSDGRRLLVERPLLDAVREVHHEGDVDVGLQERPLDLLDDLLDVRLGDARLPPEPVQSAPERTAEIVEYHLGVSRLPLR